MVSGLLLGVSLVLALPGDDSGPTAADRTAYEGAKAKAGRDPEAHIRLALWCEAHGLRAERLRHLALAVLTDPTNATARGLLGLVEYGGKWARADEIDSRIKADAELSAKLADYNARRERMPATADANWNLALWCEAEGLSAEAKAHFAAVTRLDPSREAAWKRLGFKKQGRRWVTTAQLAAERAETEAQRKADIHWKALLLKWRSMLDRKSQRAEADSGMAGVTDPRAVPSIWSVFASSNVPANQMRAVQLFGQIDAPDASRALALLVIRTSSAEIRRTAAETLARRDRREFLDTLIAAIRDPIKYEVRPVNGPGSQGALFVAGERFNIQRLYTAPPAFPNGLPMNGTIVYDQNGLPVLTGVAGFARTLEHAPQFPQFGTAGAAAAPDVPAPIASALDKTFGAQGKQVGQALAQAVSAPGVDSRPSIALDREVDYQIPVGLMMIEAQKGAVAAGQQLQNDINTVETYNTAARQQNSRVLSLMRDATGQDLGENRQAWVKWWADEQGYATRTPDRAPVPTLVQNVPPSYVPTPLSPAFALGSAAMPLSHACFGAGTPVRTLTGLRAIEQVQVGDRVLTQDATSGQLSYQPIIAVFHNRPNETLRIQLGDESIVATRIHRFWKAGQGWVMARDLKAGDTIRVVGGTARIGSIEPDTIQPVFNLQVADGQSFFVGAAGALVHDNSLVQPVHSPFDATPTSRSGVGDVAAHTE